MNNSLDACSDDVRFLDSCARFVKSANDKQSLSMERAYSSLPSRTIFFDSIWDMVRNDVVMSRRSVGSVYSSLATAFTHSGSSFVRLMSTRNERSEHRDAAKRGTII